MEVIKNTNLSDREVPWSKNITLLTKTDVKGNIEYVNENFLDVSGYDDYELIGKPHSIVRHPDMPKIIFKMLWDKLKMGENLHVIVKSLSKTGRYYWVITDYKTTRDLNGEIIAYTSKQQSVNDDIVLKFIEPLYKKLLQIEQSGGAEASEKYLIGFLEERNKTYDQYIEDLVATGKDETKKERKGGFFSMFFKRKISQAAF